ncbi:protein of unknown function [Brevefilum fermentans]|uniref:Uncharacterized protein n=1 Tax=Candidatus Brevifilum fermentans TaxID=1986204 RepID=A0A1Y6K817_9CHLR|nr:protein of unknown function [Brevefilum fermentans]
MTLHSVPEKRKTISYCLNFNYKQYLSKGFLDHYLTSFVKIMRIGWFGWIIFSEIQIS